MSFMNADLRNGKLITHPIYRFYIIRATGFRKFFAKVFYMGINEIIRISDVSMITP